MYTSMHNNNIICIYLPARKFTILWILAILLIPYVLYGAIRGNVQDLFALPCPRPAYKTSYSTVKYNLKTIILIFTSFVSLTIGKCLRPSALKSLNILGNDVDCEKC